MENPKSFFEKISRQSQDLFFFYDFENKYFECLSNDVQPLLGLSREEINAQPQKLLKLFEQADKEYIETNLNKLKEQGPQPLDIEIRLHLPNQTLSWVRVKAYVYGEPAASAQLIVIVEDINRRKEQELGLIMMKEQKNIIVQVLGHDLRAPLNTISLSMTLLEKELDLEKNKNIQELIEIVERTCRNSLDMIKEVLHVEYIETQEIELKRNRLDIVPRIQNQVDTLRLFDKTNKVILFHKPAETVYATADVTRLMLIVENLLTNAYKFTDENGRIEVKLEEQQENIILSIADNGIGIPEKLKPLIFDKFTKARRKGIQGEQTVGLGMHLIKTMVKQLEGRIWFESEEGKGSTFYVELPK